MKVAKQYLTIEIAYSGGLTQAERNETVKRLAEHIIRDIDTAGIVPDGCDEYTASITVKDIETDITVTHKFE
jgi:hypothetical protein